MTEAASWRDLLRGGLAVRFALLILGVWLNAADTLVTVTVMPSVAHEIGGYAYFGWATAVFLLGAITAGASSGVLGQRIGVRAAMAGAGIAYSLGCVLSALSPGIGVFLMARLAQGLGAGWIVGLVFVAVGSMFPASQWAKAMATTTGVWGLAILLGPALGGLFAASGAHGWRGVFWFFAIQGLAFSIAAGLLLPKNAPKDLAAAFPWRQLLMLAVGVLALASAGLVRSPVATLSLAVAGLALLFAMVRLDATAPASMLPRQTRNLGSAAGAGYLTIFLLESGVAGWGVYGAAMIQSIYGVNPLIAGYAVGGMAVGWTCAALAISNVRPNRHSLFIRIGAACVFLGLLAITCAIGRAPLLTLAASAALMGCGFGLCWSFMGTRILEGLPDGERGLGAGAIPTVQMIGAAVGAAGASALGDVLGLADGMTRLTALRAAPLLFSAFLPLSVLAWIAAHRLAGLGSVAKP